jgi:lipopolysaccharide heptosyltransferase II
MGNASGLSRRRFDRILLIKPSSLGDIVHALPVLSGLRQRYRQAQIAWLAGSPYVTLLRAHPAVNEVIPFDRRRYGMVGRDLRVSVDFADFLHKLWSRRFDLAIDLQGLLRSGFLGLASGARFRIGFANARELGWLFYTHRIPPGSSDSHAVDKYYRVAEALGFGDLPKDFTLPLPPGTHERARAMLAQAGLAQRPYAVLVPAARWQTKRWPSENYARLADAVAQRLGLAAVLIGAAAEAELCYQVQRRAATGLINLAGKSTLPELVAVLRAAQVVVSNDSGPMHVAAALERPVVALFGPTNPARTGPYLAAARVIRKALPCSPCYLRRLSQCPHQHQCLRQIGVEEVFTQIADLAGRRSSDRPAQAAS